MRQATTLAGSGASTMQQRVLMRQHHQQQLHLQQQPRPSSVAQLLQRQHQRCRSSSRTSLRCYSAKLNTASTAKRAASPSKVISSATTRGRRTALVVAAPPPSKQQQELGADDEQQQQQQAAGLLPAVRGVVRSVTAAVNAIDPRIRGLIALNFMTILMSTNWVVLKESNSAFDPMVFTSLRFTLAAAAFLPFLLQGVRDKQVRGAGLEIGMWTAAGYLAQSWALALTAASRASLLSTFTVIAVPCIAGVSGQRVKPLVWACGLAAIAGTCLLEWGGGESGSANAGDLLSIASAVMFAAQIFRTEQATRELPAGSSLKLMSITLATIAATSCAATAVVHWQDAADSLAALGAVLGTALASFGPGDSPAGAAKPLWELIYTSFCSTDLVLLIELVALQSVSSTEAALIYSLEPVGGAALAYAFLGERFGPLGWWGAGLILAASLACQLGGAIEGGSDGGSDGGSGDSKEAAT